MLAYRLETEQHSDATTVVRVAGELDMYTAPSFEQVLTPALADGAQRVVVDLSECEFLDSSALGILDAACASLDGKAELVLVASDPNILKFFQIAGLDRVFTVERAVPTTRRPAINHGSGANESRPRAVLKLVNEEIKNLSDQFGLDGTRAFVCECANSECAETVAVTGAQYEAVRQGGGLLIAMTHENLALEHVAHEDDTFAVVELLEDSRRLRAWVTEGSDEVH